MSLKAGASSEADVVGPSNRSFGFVAAGALGLIAILPLWHGSRPRSWAAALSLLFVGTSLARPTLLAPLQRIWLAIGLALHRVMSPIVLAVVFFVGVTPFAVLVRVLHPQLARRIRPNASASTYWIARDAGASPMDQQF